ncbi:GAMYB transcription factor [Trema orientale]|uniref:GAMYB transcription factor n=1 Tax=Trema orientale TaxID=63057 RepID=A0A2P5CQD8_TREOI|nr:GAMYB transcription factor [Trema orientale]
MVVEGEGMGLKEMYDSATKVRKPYTITKQREKWTDEEHQKFLEALKLYGRGWRQIEEHVGTKTAVQIRSHAQKFFSKVVRGSTGSVEVSMQPIEIPPPRPKKKPMHPYPRKSADSLNVSVFNQSERSPSPNFTRSVKGLKSPTSVLSTHGSDALGSAASDQHSRSPSSMSCTTDIQLISLSPSEKENDHLLSNSSTDEQRSLPTNGISACSTLENMLTVKFESCAKDTEHTKEEAKLSASTSFKLFGRTVLLSDLGKEPPSGVEVSKTLKADQGLVLKLSRDQLDTDLSLGGVVSDCNPLECGAPIKPLEQQKESSNAVKADASMLWWSSYQLPFHYVVAYNSSIDQTSPNSCAEEKMEDKEAQKERSCTDSNEDSTTGVETLGGKNIEAVKSFSQELRTRGSVEPCNSRKGFVPYKRCLAERDNGSSVIISNDRERQKIRVC